MKSKYSHVGFLNGCAQRKNEEGKLLMTSGPLWCNPGLCFFTGVSIDENLLELFTPTSEDLEWLEWEGNNLGYWGSEHPGSAAGILTPLRETIVMFMAAMNGEL